MYKHIYLVLIICCCSLGVLATHNRAGEITYEQIGDLTIRATITTYTKASSIPADRDSLFIVWGDGASQWVLRNNGNGMLLPNDVKVNFYIAEHTYPGRSRYVISMTDPNRNGGIINVNPPNSDNVAFHLETTITFLNPQFQGYNNSPILLQPPIDIGCVGQPFIHNPNAYDVDGDSLAYFLIVPLQEVGSPVPNYSFPNQIVPSPQNIIALDPITGTFSWNSPQLDGEYNIAMIIVEYRNGNPLDTLIRDMQITIENCENQPPQITTIDKICVVAGDTIAFDVIATDPNNDEVEITPFGGPLVVATSPATFNVPAGFNTPPVIGRFQWITDCNHISDQYYSIIFRAADNYVIIDSTSGLSTLKVVRIKVVGPPPQDVNAIVENGGIDVTWQRPYACEDALDNYFRGFSVWRREGSNPFELDTCVTGLDGRGYTQLNFNTNEVIGDRYYFRDTNISRGKTYCYRILANFAKVSPGGNPFNAVESLPSQEACTQLGRDIPLLTNVSVLTTQATTGELWLRWSKPVAADLDTVLNPPPYTYKLLRANGLTGTNFTEVVSFTKPTFASANDTIFTDTNRNTVDLGYNYKLQFFTGNSATEPLGESEAASSVYLTIASSDRQNTLSWQPVVPWANFQTVIYRKNNSTNNFDSIAVVTQNNFLDDELINGEEYCYYVKTIGSYGISGIVDPLENLSQQACGVPLDTVPPCPPMLSVANICTDNTLALTDVQNLLNWTQPIRQCLNATDVTQYRIYFADNNSAELQLIESLNNVNDTTWIHNLDFSLAGCYAVTAVDSVGNESAKSNLVCVDNCPYYTLPNTFTPNGDGQNDFFKPYPYKFIESIDFQVFNRWGNQIFSTQNPDILWGGTTNSGEILPAGVYFYTCKVFERRVQGILQNATVLSGYIELLKE